MKQEFLSTFTPSLMSPEALEAVFVQREALARRLIERISESATTGSRHQQLLIGPRGIGKTHLVALVYHRLRATAELRRRLAIAWLKEEEWGISSLLDLFLRIHAALDSDEGPFERERLDGVFDLSPREAENVARDVLLARLGERVLAVLAENLDGIFTGLGERGQRALRAFMQEEGRLVFLATAQGLFQGISRQTSPFYGTFEIHHLEQLTTEEAVDLIARSAELRGDQELASFVKTPAGQARIRAVGHLAGGNHRVYAILSHLLTRQSLDDLVEPFMGMVDELTPYYQSRMADLSPQQCKIVEILCDNRAPLQVKEIARRCFLPQRQVSVLLKALREKGYVRSEQFGRNAFYEMREPLMRICLEVKKQRGGPIRLFVDFLRIWFSPKELRDLLPGLLPASVGRKYIETALKEARETSNDPVVREAEREFERALDLKDFVRALSLAQEIHARTESTRSLTMVGFCCLSLKRFDDALDSLHKALAREPNSPAALALTAAAYLLGGDSEAAMEEAERLMRRALDACQDPSARSAIASRVLPLGPHVLLLQGRLDEALAASAAAVDENPRDNLAWMARSEVTWWAGSLPDALAASARGIELDPGGGFAAFYRGLSLLWQGNLDAATPFLRDLLSSPDSALLFPSHAEPLLRRCLTVRPWLGPDGIKQLTTLFVETGQSEALAKSLLSSSDVLLNAMNTVAAGEDWLARWEAGTKGIAEFEMPLRVARALLEFRKSGSQQALMSLPSEERSIAEELIVKARGDVPPVASGS